MMSRAKPFVSQLAFACNRSCN